MNHLKEKIDQIHLKIIELLIELKRIESELDQEELKIVQEK